MAGPKTISTRSEVLAPLIKQLGRTKLRDLTAADVRSALTRVAATRSTRTVQDAHSALVRVLTFAQASGRVGRNVAALVTAPRGKGVGRPSKALTLEQAKALLAASGRSRLHGYVVLSLLTGIRTEEARALRWDHVDLDGNPHADPPVPPSAAVWRSVRSDGDVKTQRSRRTLQLPIVVVDALRRHQEKQAEDRELACPLWEEHGLVFCSSLGTPLDAANVRREFRHLCTAAGISERFSPRELRHSYVSLMSNTGMPIEEIARLIGHSSSQVTQAVYRKELRPVITTGAEVIDQLFPANLRTGPRQ